MKLWKLVTRAGSFKLLPAAFSEQHIAQCNKVAVTIPGARWDGSGEVDGADSALAACLELAGQSEDAARIWNNGWRGWKSDPKILGMSIAPWGWMPEYQRLGAAFIADRISSGVMVNDDVGLGKTFQTIAAMSILDFRTVKVVLCPASLRRQWRDEIAKWCELHGGPPVQDAHYDEMIAVIYPKGDKRSKKAPPRSPSWVIAYYLDADRALALVDKRPYYMIVDEIHNFQHFGSKRLAQVQQQRLLAHGCVSLTASPLWSHAAQMYPMLNITSPGYWGNFEQWATRYASAYRGEHGLVTGALSHDTELYLRGTMHGFRRIKSDVADQLPFDVKYQSVWLDAPPGNAKVIEATLSSSGEVVQDWPHIRAVEEFKVGAVAEQIKSDVASGIPGITFTWTRRHAEQIAAAVPGALIAHGGIPSSKRLPLVYDYVARCKGLNQVPQLVTTYDGLGVGGNLQAFKVVNLAALTAEPDKIIQAIGRSARMGQEGTVVTRIFMCHHTVDEYYGKVLLVPRLMQQQKRDGRAEPSKVELREAISPGAGDVKGFLSKMLEKYKNIGEDA